jgi:signal transduction histidine kinase
MWTRKFYSGHWQVRVRHGGAPIPARIEQQRRRELSIAFGLLALLAAGVAVTAMDGQRARRQARRQAELVARVSHELRTPLAVLAAAGDNLADSLVHDRAQIERYGRLIQQASRRLREVAENILHLARRQGMAPPAPLRPLDVGGLVEETLRLSRPQLEQAGFAVEKVFPERPLQVLGEPRALRSALLNLISNAIKYGRSAGWLRLTVATVRARGGEEVEIAVEDRGPGIPASELSRLFEPYYRGERARVEQIEGTGLGLAVVSEVAATHRGRVTVDSSPGGSVFRLYLPRLVEG